MRRRRQVPRRRPPAPVAARAPSSRPRRSVEVAGLTGNRAAVRLSRGAAGAAATLQRILIGKEDPNNHYSPQAAVDALDGWYAPKRMSPYQRDFALGEIANLDRAGRKFWGFYGLDKAIRWDVYGAVPWSEHRAIDASGVRQVIGQAAYMTGDMFGVYAALKLDPTVGLLLFTDGGQARADERLGQLKEFYITDGEESVAKRIGVVPVINSQWAYQDAQGGRTSDFYSFAYQRYGELATFPTALTIGNATRIVAENFKADLAGSRAKLQESWLRGDWQAGKPTGAAKGKEGQETIAAWVKTKGFDKGQKYAFIWFRASGGAGGAHEELDTSVTATHQLVESTRDMGAKAVVVGDAGHGLTQGSGKGKVDIDLTEFWNDADSPFYKAGRRTQLALFGYLREEGYSLVNVGMRSGALEGPVLLGVPTIFMEEKENLQAGRMAQWLEPTERESETEGIVPEYARLELEHVPTKRGKQVLDDLLARQEAGVLRDLRRAIAALVGVLAQEGQLVRKIGNAEAHEKAIDTEIGSAPSPEFRDCAAAMKRALGWRGSIEDTLWQKLAPHLATASRMEREWRFVHGKRDALSKYTGPEEGLSQTDLAKAAQSMKGTLRIS